MTRPAGVHPARRCKQRGFTLLEVMVVLALGVVGLLGVTAVSVSATRAHVNSRSFTEATLLAQDQLERLRYVPYAALNDTMEPSVSPIGSPMGGTYRRQTTVETLDNTKRITVNVSWYDRFTRTVTMNALRVP